MILAMNKLDSRHHASVVRDFDFECDDNHTYSGSFFALCVKSGA